MEGKFRPGHFEGVIEVVKRLLSHIKTTYLFLGKKDYQQLIIIKKYLENTNSKIKVVPCDTIRARNGVALSSRNKLLNERSLIIAGKIISFLKRNKNQIIKSKKNKFFLKKIKEFITLKKSQPHPHQHLVILLSVNSLPKHTGILI